MLLDAQMREIVRSRSSRPRWIIPDVLPVGLSILYGPSGVGKTGVAIAIAMAIAGEGDGFGGHVAEYGAALFVGGEDYHGVMRRIVVASEASGGPYPVGLERPPSGGIASSGSGAWLLSQAMKLAEWESHEGVATPVRLIVIDTLGACYGLASQDDASAASIFMNELDHVSQELGCAVLITHHVGKSAGREPRGSQVFSDRADMRMRISHRAGGGLLTVEKMRDGVAGAEFSFAIDSVPFRVPAASDWDEGRIETVQIIRNIVAVPSHAMDGEAAIASEPRHKFTDRDAALSILKAINTAGKPVPIKDWQNACFTEWKNRSPNARNAAFSRVKKQLVDKGLVAIRGDFVTDKFTKNSGKNTVKADAGFTGYVITPPLKGGDSDNVGKTAVRAPRIGRAG